MEKKDPNLFEHVVISREGLSSFTDIKDGKNIVWTTDVNVELPIVMGPEPEALTPPKTFIQLFEDRVKKTPKRAALNVERNGKWIIWTFEEYLADIKRFAKALVHMGVRERSAVNIIGFNSPEWAIAFFGPMFANVIPSGVYTTNAADACFYVADHSEAEVIVVENKVQLAKYESILKDLPRVKAIVVYADSVPEGSSSIVMTWEKFMGLGKELKDSALNERISHVRPGMCCNLVYTSGTTGPPKGVMLSHDSMIWESTLIFDLLDDYMKITDDERVVSYLPLSHVAAQSIDLLGAVTSGTKVYFARPDALQGTLVETMKQVRPTLFFAVPRVWEKFEERMKEAGAQAGSLARSLANWAKSKGYEQSMAKQKGGSSPFCYSFAHWLILGRIKKALGLDASKFFLFGAAPLKKSTRDYFLSLDMQLHNWYGMSETSGGETYSLKEVDFDAAGKPLPGTHLKIFNPDENGEGEIIFAGRNMFMGYFKNEEATKSTKDIEGYVHSGDLGMIDKNGFLKITGRLKELIITAGGENVAPVLIEDILKEQCPIISNVMVVGDNRKYLTALITLRVDVELATGKPT